MPASPEFRSSPPRGRVLLFSPHPDDEVIGAGGALCLHREQGDPVRVVIATDGITGDPDARFERQGYAESRRAESRAGLARIGVGDVRFWGMPDSCVLSGQDLEWGTTLCERELGDYRPDIVYLPWEREGHPDHFALYVVVMRALRRSAFRGEALGYEVWHAMVPDLILDITPVAGRKRAAIEEHGTQLAYVDMVHVTMGLDAHRSLIHMRGKGYGEAFRFLWPERDEPGA
ncbi:MAG: PIG-L family deacetylase [Planctomycetota bacterium]